MLFCMLVRAASMAVATRSEKFEAVFVLFAESIVLRFRLFEQQFTLEFLQLNFARCYRSSGASFQLFHQLQAIVLGFLSL